MTVQIRDVTLRDGLQLVGRPLPTERKVQLVRELLALGVEHVEVGSMARPDLVPTLADTLDVVKLNTDENPAVTGKLGITSIPTMHVYKDGEIVKTIVGAKPKPALLRELADFLG